MTYSSISQPLGYCRDCTRNEEPGTYRTRCVLEITSLHFSCSSTASLLRPALFVCFWEKLDLGMNGARGTRSRHSFQDKQRD